MCSSTFFFDLILIASFCLQFKKIYTYTFTFFSQIFMCEVIFISSCPEPWLERWPHFQGKPAWSGSTRENYRQEFGCLILHHDLLRPLQVSFLLNFWQTHETGRIPLQASLGISTKIWLHLVQTWGRLFCDHFHFQFLAQNRLGDCHDFFPSLRFLLRIPLTTSSAGFGAYLQNVRSLSWMIVCLLLPFKAKDWRRTELRFWTFLRMLFRS